MRYIEKKAAPDSLDCFNILELFYKKKLKQEDIIPENPYPTYERLCSDRAKRITNIENDSDYLNFEYEDIKILVAGREESIKTIDIVRQQLWEEQKGICCYCMQFIKPTYQKEIGESSIVEHFLPRTAFPEEHTNYYNLYLSCCYSEGAATHERHCDDAKKEKVIPKYIGYYSPTSTEPRKICEDFFQYSSEGEILPYGKYKSWQRFLENYNTLDGEQKQIMGTIEMLGLNIPKLLIERKDFITKLLPQLMGKKSDELKEMLKVYQNSFFKEFAGVATYFINLKITPSK